MLILLYGNNIQKTHLNSWRSGKFRYFLQSFQYRDVTWIGLRIALSSQKHTKYTENQGTFFTVESYFTPSAEAKIMTHHNDNTLWLCTWWRHQMETFSALLAICAGNSPAPVNSPHKRQWGGALMFSLICVWINSWGNNREAGDLRRYRVHYDVSVMDKNGSLWFNH